MTTKQYLEMDLSDFLSMNDSQLRKAVGVLRDTAHKRYKRIKEGIGDTQATQSLERSGGEISVKGLSFNELRKEFIRAKNFLQMKTSTVSNYRKIEVKTLKELKKRGVSMTREQYKNFWKIYEDVKERDPMVADRQYKYKILDYISSNMEDMTSDDLINNALDRLRESYEMSQSHEDTEFWTNLFEQQGRYIK